LNEWNDNDNYLGKKWVFGNLIGYNEHNKFFGSATKATPDGRYDGEMTNFGIGQSTAKDRSGLTALLNSVAKCDPEAVFTGPSVTNVLIEEQLIKNDEHFEKLVDLFQTYFLNGGTHFQLNYVSKEDLINAKKTPEDYKNLRVRVSGFSDYFVFLNDALQDEIITTCSTFQTCQEHEIATFQTIHYSLLCSSRPMRRSVSSTRKRVQTTDCLRASFQYLMYVVATTVPSGSR
jgi:autonomous glycyl radical cofactor GrcA